MMSKEFLYQTEAKTIYREGDKVVKMFSHDYSKANVLNEALNQARVEETGKVQRNILTLFAERLIPQSSMF